MVHERRMTASPIVPYIEYFRKNFQRCQLQSKTADVLVDKETNVMMRSLKMEPLRLEIRNIVEIERYQRMVYDFPFEEEIQRNIIHCQFYSLDEEVLDARSFQLQPPLR
jgi:hypothetical protein